LPNTNTAACKFVSQLKPPRRVVEAVEREGSKAVWVKRSDAKIPAKSLKQNNFLGKIFPYRTLTDSDGVSIFYKVFHE
jgi:hypothetical protein